MYVVSEKFKDAAYSRSRNVAVKVTFNGTTVLDGNNIIDITIKETITSSERLTMGDACSSMAKVKFLMPAEALPLHGSYFKAEVGLMVDGAFEYCPLGTYYVTDFETKDNFRIVEVTAYDGMSKLNNRYETTLESFPASIMDVLSDIQAQYPGIVNLAETTYPDYLVDYVDCTAREMVGYIAGLLGCNARINRDNQLIFCWYSGSEAIGNDSVYMNGYTTSSKEEYTFSSITVGELEAGSGSGIEFSNPFITQEILESILAEKGNVSYMPSTLKYRCNPAVECGDICIYEGKQILVMSQTIKVSGGMSSTISCFTGESNTVMKESPTDRKINKAYTELTESFKVATELLKGARGGYFEILTDEQGFPTGWTIRDTAEVIDTTRMWLMNYAGLAFSSDGGKTFNKVAITMNGEISADAINTQELFAKDIALTGNLNIGGNGALYYNAKTGELSIRAKEISIGGNSVITEKGVDEKLSNVKPFLYIRYSPVENPTASQMTATPNENTVYMGVCHTSSEVALTDPSEYTWHKIKGEDGKDATTYYTWVKYADTPTSGMSNEPEGKKYIGLAYNKTSATESTNYSDYQWSLIKGEDGTDGYTPQKGVDYVDGKDGKTYYTWIKYADDASGTGMSDDPTDKKYIGIAYNKESITESSKASDYQWSLFRGEDGIDGYTPQKGIDYFDGVSGYFYVKYSDNADGNPMTDTPTDSTMYMGVCSTTSDTAPTDHTKYTWTKCRGEDGIDGTNGTRGAGIYSVTTAPLSYTTPIGGFRPIYRIALSTVQNQSGASQILVGDNIRYSYYLYPVGYVNSSYVYLGTRTSIRGATGADGKGIASTSCTYQVGESGTTAPTGEWLSDVPDVPEGKYLWTRTIITYTDESTETSYSVSRMGIDGSNGEPGKDGVDGKTQYLHVKYSDDGKTFTADNGETLGAWIGTLVDFNKKDSTTFSDYTWKKFTEDVRIGARNYFAKVNINNLATAANNTFIKGTSYRGNTFKTSPGEEWTLYRTGTTNNRWAVYWSTDEPADGVSVIGGAFIDHSQDAGVINHFIAPDNANYGYIYLSTQGDEIPNIMLEKGNCPTDWKPAQEDVDDELNAMQGKVENVDSRMNDAELKISSLKGEVVSIAVDAAGKTTLIQNGSGWQFDIDSVKEDLGGAVEALQSLSGKVTGVETLSENLKTVISGLENKTSYMKIDNDENGNPYLELGKSDSDFKVRLTNTSLIFMQEATPVAYISNKTLYISKAIIKSELHIMNEKEEFGFVWTVRKNGNMGLRWKGSDEQWLQ